MLCSHIGVRLKYYALNFHKIVSFESINLFPIYNTYIQKLAGICTLIG